MKRSARYRQARIGNPTAILEAWDGRYFFLPVIAPVRGRVPNYQIEGRVRA